MHKYWVLSVLLLLSGFSATAQKDASLLANSEYQNIEYVPGRLLVKLKPQFRTILQGSAKRSARVQKTFQKLKLRSQQMYHAPYIRKHRQRAHNPSGVDVSLFYQIEYDRNLSLEEAIREMKALGVFQYVEPDVKYRFHYQPSDSLLADQYYLESVKAFEAWDITQGNEDILIGIVDAGTHLNHPDLVNILYKNEAEIAGNGIDDDENGYIDDVQGWDFAGSDTLRPREDNNPQIFVGGFNAHGTWVAGAAAAQADNEIGIAGISFRSKILTTKHTFDNQREDDSGVYNPYAGVIYLTENRVDVMNLSWGGFFRSDIAEEIVNVAALDEDIVVVAAAGNAGGFRPEYPASYENVVSVAAIDRNDNRASFSSQGAQISIAAPGVGILTTGFDEPYEALNGTSFASPIVAGAAALLRNQFPNFSAKQIAKQLRVTADPSLYEINNINPRTIGSGKLDIQAALSAQKPGLEFENIRIVNTRGSTNLQAGDTVLVTGDFTNYLFQSSPQLRAELFLGSPFVTVLNNSFPLGPMEPGQTISNAQEPFMLQVSEFALEDLALQMRIEFSDTNYEDYQIINLTVNPSIINIERNLVTTSLPNNGRFGFKDFPANNGLGFIYQEISLLFEMGLMMGTSPVDLSTTVRADTSITGQGLIHDHFTSIQTLVTKEPGERSVFEVSGKLDNTTANNVPSKLEIDYRSLVFADDPHDQYVIMEYDIKNVGENNIEEFFVGLYADWDIGSRDSADWNQEYRLGYIFNTNFSDTIFAGIQVLTGEPNYYPINNNQDAEGSPFGVYDGFLNGEKFTSLSSGTSVLTHANMPEGEVNDMSHTVGSGPYNIATGEAVRVAFAIHAGDDLADILRSAQAADEMYNQTFQFAKPSLSFTPSCIGESVEVTASGGSEYRWYSDPFGGEPFFEGDRYTTTPLTDDTVLYVAQVVNGVESLREPANVRMRANPALTISGRTRLCAGDTTFLTARLADAYLWSNGATTRTIAVTESGNYSVTVTDNTLGCSNTSEVVPIIVDELPTAAFQIAFDSVDIRQNTPIQFTDLSTNAVAWEWNFGNGQTSRNQNPSVLFENLGDYTITLKATSASGCTASAVGTFRLTSLDEESLLPGVSVFPNPNDGTFEFEIENEEMGTLQLEIATVEGKVVRRVERIKTANRLTHRFNLSEFPAGMYILRAQQGSRFSVKRIVKE